ncbi:hypothetical protein J6590_035666 [Homalodisca vitripennis]|nr:hypothetical protein J6590_035666 [Homalodisca vitripennis]
MPAGSLSVPHLTIARNFSDLTNVGFGRRISFCQIVSAENGPSKSFNLSDNEYSSGSSNPRTIP